MKVFLLHRGTDVDLDAPPPPNERNLIADLDLDTLLDAMAAGDELLRDVARKVLLAGLTDPDAIVYRQRVLADCLAQPAVVRRMYAIAIDALQTGRKVWLGILLRDAPEHILRRAVQMLEFLVENLHQLRRLAEEHAADFRSEGFTRFFGMLGDELDGDYFATIDEHLRTLRLPDGVLMSAELGTGNKGTRYVLHRTPRRTWWERVTGRGSAGYIVRIPPRDEAGFRALGDLADRGVNVVANALAQATDHVQSFFRVLRAELGFLLGCLNLHERLTAHGEPVCLPDPHPADARVLSARGLYDPCLSLRLGRRTVGNDVDADGRDLVMITGANQGGKSTFLRSAGVAQLMLQSGMFGCAESLRASVCAGVFTHFKREEDTSMTRGKLAEELARMSDIADTITPGSLLLCNESFASTNEREGAEIARQVVRALTESGMRILFVTHLYDLAHSCYRDRRDDTLFLRAERGPDGVRTFRLGAAEPLPTSYGEDSCRRIFAAAGPRGEGG
ncbi:MutS-related protein [Amycolatopsis nalaikhensis]|uniref:DNA mismatch repair proteins mutS family domain-containing protein n=1 Tax=Amycolatopsis nalaikhensis TaxID=715472 RepID=A0ABY8XUI4_9PSEU|nr:hypothetical protein [Amycolatopsis sp. 2-2]WIV59141.1 hypothetical protein QP939_11180 [Amycolatopsis sp. 2-2]